MRLNRPTQPRRHRTPTSRTATRRATTRRAATELAPGSTANTDHGPATEQDGTTSSLRRPRHATPTPRRRRVVFAARAAVVLMALLLTPTAHAHADQTLAQQVVAAQQVLAQAESVDAVLGNIRNWLIGILAALATVFLTIGGVRYVYGSGDPGEVEKAKQAFKAAALGYGIAALAPLIVTVLQSIVGL